MRFYRHFPILAITIGTAAAIGFAAGFQDPGAGSVDPARHAMVDAITPGSLLGHVSFLASDLLEGRDTPSRGLDVAAEYIASRFRAAGLEPAGDDGYFQTAHWTARAPDPQSYRFAVKIDDRENSPPLGSVTVDPGGTDAIAIQDAAIVRVEPENPRIR